MEMNLLLPALLTSIFCYLGAIESSLLLGMTGGFYIVGRPLVAGLLIGLFFGDIQAGVLCGLAVQGVFIANLSTGGATNSEITYASYGGIGLALATSKDPAIAVTLSILIGQTFGLIFYNTRMALYSFWNNRAQNAAENLDDRGIFLNHFVLPQISTFLIRAVPVFLAIYFGQGLVDSLLNSVPETVTHIISVLGGVLPALGIAMLMSIVIKDKIQLIFYFTGFVLVSFANLSMIALVFIASLIAYLTYLSSHSNPSTYQTSNGTMLEEKSLNDSTSYSNIPIYNSSVDDDWFEDDHLF